MNNGDIFSAVKEVLKSLVSMLIGDVDSNKKRKITMIKGALKFLIAVFVGLWVGTFISVTCIGTYEVVGHSMNPTYEEGDRLLVYKLGVPGRGDVTIVHHGEMKIVKRVVALPGDYIKVVDSVLYVNGEVVTEDYILEDEFNGGIIEDKCIQLGSGEYFVIGDNRNNSTDSREFGAVNEGDIVGIVFLELE